MILLAIPANGTLVANEYYVWLPKVKYMMGLKVPRFDKLQDTVKNLAENLTVFSWREYIVRPLHLCHPQHSSEKSGPSCMGVRIFQL